MNYEDTSPDVVLDAGQQRRMREMVRSISKDVRLFVVEMAKAATTIDEHESPRELFPATGTIPDGEAFLEKVIEEITAHLQDAFKQLPRTTGALTRQLQQSRFDLASKAFGSGVSYEEAAFYAGISPIYSTLCEIMEQQILFSPERMPQHERPGRLH